MPIAFSSKKLVLLLWLAGAVAMAGNAAAAPATSRALAETSARRYALPFELAAGQRYTVPATVDASLITSAGPLEVRVLAEVSPAIVIIVDTFASRPGPMSMCGAGLEKTLRVIRIAAGKAREVRRVPLESCLKGVELQQDGLSWNPETRTLKMHWLFGPGRKGRPETRSLRFR